MVRSRRASELRPHRIIKTEAMPNGSMFRQPGLHVGHAERLMICGCQRDKHWLAPDAPA